MRIVSRAELRKMPSGTLYAEYHPGRGWPSGPTDVFLGDMEGVNDFVCAGLGSPQSSDSNQMFERQHEMNESGAEYPVDLMAGRDGLFDDEMRYLVWDESDVATIAVRTAWFNAGQKEWNATTRFRTVKADGTVRYETDEEDARSTVRPGDTVEQLYERHDVEWRKVDTGR